MEEEKKDPSGKSRKRYVYLNKFNQHKADTEEDIRKVNNKIDELRFFVWFIAILTIAALTTACFS